MDKTEILTTITELLRDVLGRDDVHLQLSTCAADVRGWDSLENIRFILSIERHYGLNFSTNEITSLSKVQDIVELVAHHFP